MKFAYIALGKLYYRDGDQPSRIIESQFAQEIVNRALARQQKSSWKTGGTSSAAMMARQAMQEGDPSAIKVNITAVSPGEKPDEIMYMVTSDAVGGLFSYDLNTRTEQRIFHKENLTLSDFSRNPKKDVIACCQRMQNGTATISMRIGNDVSQVTEGDSSDESPSWVENSDKELVYQSAGVARNRSGVMIGLGPSSIQKLDLGTGTVIPLLENDAVDYLSPHATANGDLFYIARPFEPQFKRAYPWHKMLADVALFPFRLAHAIVSFLNVFSLTFSKKPLTTAGGPKMQGPDEKSLFLRGRLIEAQEHSQTGDAQSDALNLVPKSWRLVRRQADGKETTISDGVLTYDLSKDGKIIYSTGAAIYECDRDGGQRKLITKDKFVETILALD